MPAAKSKTKQPNVVMPPATCGMCAFCHPHPDDDDWRLCLALPPLPVISPDGDGMWPRGGEVRPGDPRCIFFMPRGGLQ